MIYLLDTHIVLWSLFEPVKLAEPIRQILENETDTKLISGVNMWEISLKYSLGKLELGDTDPGEVFDTLLEAGFEVAELESRLLATYHQLPRREDHRDPFDRLLIWQAITNGYTLISHDKKIEQYRRDGLRLVVR
ncbi:MAG: type II toxin-antitoxin system VapC family toxin [Ardenticatenaceae bacterium]|nr:type II toxin-antitoxin system VapC family toxin [Ardenticatenaceae bacterium]